MSANYQCDCGAIIDPREKLPQHNDPCPAVERRRQLFERMKEAGAVKETWMELEEHT